MLNNYQKYLTNINNIDKVITIAKWFNPELKDSWMSRSGKTKMFLKNKLDVRCKYSWVTIRLHNKISIGIEFEHNLMGSGWNLNDFEEAIKIRKFKIWRFVDDPFFDDSKSYNSSTNDLKYHDKLINLGVPLPTAEQLYKYYYSD